MFDSYDMYLDEYVLSTITNIAYKGSFDIIIFESITTNLKPDVNTTKIHIKGLQTASIKSQAKSPKKSPIASIP